MLKPGQSQSKVLRWAIHSRGAIGFTFILFKYTTKLITTCKLPRNLALKLSHTRFRLLKPKTRIIISRISCSSVNHLSHSYRRGQRMAKGTMKEFILEISVPEVPCLLYFTIRSCSKISVPLLGNKKTCKVLTTLFSLRCEQFFDLRVGHIKLTLRVSTNLSICPHICQMAWVTSSLFTQRPRRYVGRAPDFSGFSQILF